MLLFRVALASRMQLNMSVSTGQICFFAHSPEEVRHPTTKPFVPPEALAAATTNATLEAVRKAAADSAASQKEVKPLLPWSTPQKLIACHRLWHKCSRWWQGLCELLHRLEVMAKAGQQHSG